MIRLPGLWISVVLAIAVPATVSACSRPDGPSATHELAAASAALPSAPADPSSGAPAPGPDAASRPGCFMQLDDHGRMWSAYDVNREAQCFQLDTCSGGLGSVEDGVGHCFKWAMGPDAPALPWSATLIHPKPAADVPPPGDIQASFGEQNLDCEGNDGDECFTDPVRLAADAPIRSQPVETAPIAASIPAGECVWQARVRVLATPLRGVVLETTSTLSAGDVIYLLAFQGEHMVLWHKEKLSGAYSPTEIVARWDSADRQPDATDSWVELTRADGKTGWARNPGNTGEECNIPGR